MFNSRQNKKSKTNSKGFGGVFTVAQAACFLGLNKESIYRLIHAGSLCGLKFNQTWCLARQEVHAWSNKPSRK